MQSSSIKSPPVTDNSIVLKDAGIHRRASSFSDTKHSTVEKLPLPGQLRSPALYLRGVQTSLPHVSTGWVGGSGHWRAPVFLSAPPACPLALAHPLQVYWAPTTHHALCRNAGNNVNDRKNHPQGIYHPEEVREKHRSDYSVTWTNDDCT